MKKQPPKKKKKDLDKLKEVTFLLSEREIQILEFIGKGSRSFGLSVVLDFWVAESSK